MGYRKIPAAGPFTQSFSKVVTVLQSSKSRALAENMRNLMYCIDINSAAELSNRTHVEEKFINNCLSGHGQVPSVDNAHLQAIAQALTISVEMLFDPNPVRTLEPSSDTPRAILREMLDDCVDRLRQHQFLPNNEIARVVRSSRAILDNYC